MEISEEFKGNLFLNSKTRKLLHPSSFSKILCELINEADPGTFPQGHGIRRVVTSTAWTRVLDPGKLAIYEGLFGCPPIFFIDCYLSARLNVTGVALNTQ